MTSELDTIESPQSDVEVEDDTSLLDARENAAQGNLDTVEAMPDWLPRTYERLSNGW